jgi:hypothetical protein
MADDLDVTDDLPVVEGHEDFAEVPVGCDLAFGIVGFGEKDVERIAGTAMFLHLDHDD